MTHQDLIIVFLNIISFNFLPQNFLNPLEKKFFKSHKRINFYWPKMLSRFYILRRQKNRQENRFRIFCCFVYSTSVSPRLSAPLGAPIPAHLTWHTRFRIISHPALGVTPRFFVFPSTSNCHISFLATSSSFPLGSRSGPL